MATVESELSELESVAGPLFERYEKLVSLANVLRKDGPKHPWSGTHPHKDIAGCISHEPLSDRLAALRFREPKPEESRKHARHWADQIKHLASDDKS